ncbi:phospholipase D family protein [Vibrio sp. WXL103]|uniref:phospholipase D family protein n=1 Tax=Vibrio sp. WXL103 TaxID=3450710 RepID=UPI003EC4F488
MPVLQRISLFALLATLLGGCSSLPEQITHSSPSAPVTSTNSALLTMAEEQQSSAQLLTNSAVVLQKSGWDALAQRLAIVESAEQSIDIQYYIWNSDASGTYLASRLIAAAERGVRVRVMLDDINLNEREDLLSTLDAHPNIEIRIFNPIPSRKGKTKMLRVLGDFSRLNRRMHNKTFTVDSALSIVGGRNIGDEYFDLSDEINFRDRDALVMGDVVAEVESSFTTYWDSPWAYPIALLGGEADSKIPDISRVSVPVYQNYPALPQDKDTAHQYLKQVMARMSWVRAMFIADQPVPDDAANTDVPKATALRLGRYAQNAQQQVLIESAYLVFDDRQLKGLQALVDDGVEIKALTNSMVSNDLLTNHSGYAGRRQDMLEHGVELFELKPSTALCQTSTKDAAKCAPSVPYGLHTKSVVFDRKYAGIGSFNFNLRSTYLNTESVLLIEDHAFAELLAQDIEQTMLDENSWHLELDEGDIRWHSGGQTWNTDPDTGRWERFQSRFIQLFPIEKYL